MPASERKGNPLRLRHVQGDPCNQKLSPESRGRVRELAALQTLQCKEQRLLIAVERNIGKKSVRDGGLRTTDGQCNVLPGSVWASLYNRSPPSDIERALCHRDIIM